jgi:hypothetical protein
MRCLCLVLILAATCTQVVAVGQIVSGPILNPANGNGYYLLEPASWTVSQAAAVSLGGNLVTVNDAAEQDWLVSQFGPINSDDSPNSFWIGLNDVAIEGQFEWASGELVSYLNWFPGEPNGDLSGPSHDYAYVGRFANGQWNDDTNSISFPLPPRGVVEVALPEVVSGPIVNPANGHGYYLLESSSWTESQVKAEALGGNLVTINDAEEQDWLVSQFGPINSDNSPNSFWTGLNDVATEGLFEWVSGEPVSYLNWFPGEPNGAVSGPAHDYAYVGRFANGQWNDELNTFGSPVPHGVVEIAIPEPSSLILIATLGFVTLNCRW